MTPLDEGKFPRHYCGVDQRLSHEAHNLGIVGSSPTLRKKHLRIASTWRALDILSLKG